MRSRNILAVACFLVLGAPALADEAPMMKMGAMHEMMQRMQSQMKQIQAATDPKERQRLMEEHMKSMGEAMPMMAAMGQGCMGTMQPQK